MRRVLEALGLALLVGGCAYVSIGGKKKDETHPVMTYLALGDSYTIGEGVESKERYPMQLAALLRDKGFGVPDPVIIARTGWTTDELAAAITDSLPNPGTFSLVTLLIGVNNQYRGRAIDEYREQFVSVLERAIGFAGGDSSHVVVLSIPDWGVTTFAKDRNAGLIASEINLYNEVNREETRKAGARYVDVTHLSRRHGSDPGYLVGDGLHPSGKAYAEWAKAALPQAEEALER
jgi:lysophospholipase L1-like esterase